jgi:hypothetical protein
MNPVQRKCESFGPSHAGHSVNNGFIGEWFTTAGDPAHRDLARRGTYFLNIFQLTVAYFASQSNCMRILRRSLAAVEVTLVLPAVLFMSALFLRSIQPTEFQPAHTAQQIVDWYAGRPHLGLWVLLIALPMMVVTVGLAWLARSWRNDADLRDSALKLLMIFRSQTSALIVFAATSVAMTILAIVALHVLTD